MLRVLRRSAEEILSLSRQLFDVLLQLFDLLLFRCGEVPFVLRTFQCAHSFRVQLLQTSAYDSHRENSGVTLMYFSKLIRLSRSSCSLALRCSRRCFKTSIFNLNSYDDLPLITEVRRNEVPPSDCPAALRFRSPLAASPVVAKWQTDAHGHVPVVPYKIKHAFEMINTSASLTWPFLCSARFESTLPCWSFYKQQRDTCLIGAVVC